MLGRVVKEFSRSIFWIEQGFLFFGLLSELCDSVFDVFVFEVDFRLTGINYIDGDRSAFTSPAPTPAALGSCYGLNDSEDDAGWCSTGTRRRKFRIPKSEFRISKKFALVLVMS